MNKKIRWKPYTGISGRYCLGSLVPTRWPVLLEAFLTVDWSAFGWFEWNLGLLATVAAGNLVHLFWTTVEPAPLSITHYFHSYYVMILRR